MPAKVGDKMWYCSKCGEFSLEEDACECGGDRFCLPPTLRETADSLTGAEGGAVVLGGWSRETYQRVELVVSREMIASAMHTAFLDPERKGVPEADLSTVLVRNGEVELRGRLGVVRIKGDLLGQLLVLAGASSELVGTITSEDRTYEVTRQLEPASPTEDAVRPEFGYPCDHHKPTTFKPCGCQEGRPCDHDGPGDSAAESGDSP